MKLITVAVILALVSDVVVGVEIKPPLSNCVKVLNDDVMAASGVYELTIPNVNGPMKVYCDMDTDCGGWMVFQRRQDGSVNFDRGWDDYKNGFGNMEEGEFWLGLEKIYGFTSYGKPIRLRVDMETMDGRRSYAEYNSFKVAGEAEKYKMTYNEISYFGIAGDALGGGVKGPADSQNGMKFSTFDQDNDNSATQNCAKDYHGGWWYNGCYSSNPNSPYDKIDWAGGLNLGDLSQYKYIDMKLRQNTF